MFKVAKSHTISLLAISINSIATLNQLFNFVLHHPMRVVNHILPISLCFSFEFLKPLVQFSKLKSDIH